MHIEKSDMRRSKMGIKILFISLLICGVSFVEADPLKSKSFSSLIHSLYNGAKQSFIQTIWQREISNLCDIEMPSETLLTDRTRLHFNYIPVLCVVLYDTSKRFIQSGINDDDVASKIPNVTSTSTFCSKMMKHTWTTSIEENKYWLSNFTEVMKHDKECERWCVAEFVNPLCTYALGIDLYLMEKLIPADTFTKQEDLKQARVQVNSKQVHQQVDSNLVPHPNNSVADATATASAVSVGKINNSLSSVESSQYPNISVKGVKSLEQGGEISRDTLPSSKVESSNSQIITNALGSFNEGVHSTEVYKTSHSVNLSPSENNKGISQSEIPRDHSTTLKSLPKSAHPNTDASVTEPPGSSKPVFHRLKQTEVSTKKDSGKLSQLKKYLEDMPNPGTSMSEAPAITMPSDYPVKEGTTNTRYEPKTKALSTNNEEKFKGTEVLKENAVYDIVKSETTGANNANEGEMGDVDGDVDDHEDQKKKDDEAFGSPEEDSLGAPEENLPLQDKEVDTEDKSQRFESDNELVPKPEDPSKDYDPGRVTQNDAEAGFAHDRFVEAEDSHFFAYFMTMIILCIIGYLVFHNKQKILALALEGRARKGARRRPSTSGYRKLDSNLEEAVTSNCTGSSVTHVIY